MPNKNTFLQCAIKDIDPKEHFWFIDTYSTIVIKMSAQINLQRLTTMQKKKKTLLSSFTLYH